MEIVELSACIAALFASASQALATAGQGALDDLAQSAIDSVKEKAVSIWNRLRGTQDDELQDAIDLVDRKPADDRRLALLADVIASRLHSNPELYEELIKEFANSPSLQEVRATQGGSIERVVQSLRGDGRQSVVADDSQVSDIRQQKF